MNLLPLGSIVVLKNGYKNLIHKIPNMDTQQSENKIWDYLGVLYPEGYLGLGYTFLFNNTDIQQVIFKGYLDLEEDAFKLALKNLNK